MFARRVLGFAVLGILASTASALADTDLALRKGPILHLIKDKQQVRIQSAALAHPELEWKKAGDADGKKIDLKADAYNFWEADLPQDAAQYRILDGERRTPWFQVPNAGKDRDTFTFIAYGDNRAGWDHSDKIHRQLLANMAKDSPAFVLNTGDLVFGGDHEDYWDKFFNEGHDLFASVPFEPSIGNHDSSQRNFYGLNFDLGENKQAYYYYEYGHSVFIALDTTRNFAPGSAQYKFLVDRLEKARGKSPIVVFFHHPAYSFSMHKSDPQVQSYLVPLFEKYGVDLVLTGHDHNYQRVGPLNGVTYIVTGGGGGPLYRVNNNPLLKSYKEVFHYIVFEVGKKSIRGTMKYRYDITDDEFEIPYRASPEASPTPQHQKDTEKARP